MRFFKRKGKKENDGRKCLGKAGNVRHLPQAKIMPGRSREQRTFRIKSVFPNGRVTLHDFLGEHREAAFEPVVFDTGSGINLPIVNFSDLHDLDVSAGEPAICSTITSRYLGFIFITKTGATEPLNFLSSRSSFIGVK